MLKSARNWTLKRGGVLHRTYGGTSFIYEASFFKAPSVPTMARAPEEQLKLVKLANDDNKPSTSREESPRPNKERKSSDSRSFPSWHFGQTRSSRAASIRASAAREEKIELPNVLRDSRVESKIIPPLPRLSLQEEMPEKLSRMLRKLDKLMLDKTPEDDVPNVAASSAPGPSKAKAD